MTLASGARLDQGRKRIPEEVVEMEQKLTRRSVLITGICAVGAAIASDQQLAGGQSTSATGADRQLQFVTSLDSSFSAEVEALFPGLTTDPRFLTIAPLCGLLKHRSGPAVRAYSIAYSVTSGSGVYETALYHIAAPGSRRKGKHGRTIASGQADVLAAGTSRLVTPFFTLSPRAYRQSATNWYQAVSAKAPSSFLASQLVEGSQVRVALDAAVFKDRKVLGPDVHRLAKLLRCRRNGEHDEAVAILHMLRSGATDSEVQEALYQHGNQVRWSAPGAKGWFKQHKPSAKVHYEQARKHHAQLLLKKFNALGRERFTRLVDRLSKLHNTKLTKLAA